MVCPIDSLFEYAKQALNRGYGIKIEAQPSFNYWESSGDWGITMLFEGKHYAATVCNGFATLKTETEHIIFKLEKNQWALRSRCPVDDFDDLPF